MSAHQKATPRGSLIQPCWNGDGSEPAKLAPWFTIADHIHRSGAVVNEVGMGWRSWHVVREGPKPAFRLTPVHL
jgi:hypothetical protein